MSGGLHEAVARAIADTMRPYGEEARELCWDAAAVAIRVYDAEAQQQVEACPGVVRPNYANGREFVDVQLWQSDVLAALAALAEEQQA